MTPCVQAATPRVITVHTRRTLTSALPLPLTLTLTQVIKKNLNPRWDQAFEWRAPLRELLAAPLQLELLDYDMLSRDDPLGGAVIDLRGLMHAARCDLTVPLSTQGQVHLTCSWTPAAAAASYSKAGAADPLAAAVAASASPGQLPAATSLPAPGAMGGLEPQLASMLARLLEPRLEGMALTLQGVEQQCKHQRQALQRLDARLDEMGGDPSSHPSHPSSLSGGRGRGGGGAPLRPGESAELHEILLSVEWPAALLKMHATSHDLLRTLLLAFEEAVTPGAMQRSGSLGGAVLGGSLGGGSLGGGSLGGRGLSAPVSPLRSFRGGRHQVSPRGEMRGELRGEMTVRDLERQAGLSDSQGFSWCV